MPDSAEMNFSFGCARKMPLKRRFATICMLDDGAMHTKTSAGEPAASCRNDTSALPDTMWISAGTPVSSIASHSGSHDGSPKGATFLYFGWAAYEMQRRPRPYM